MLIQQTYQTPGLNCASCLSCKFPKATTITFETLDMCQHHKTPQVPKPSTSSLKFLPHQAIQHRFHRRLRFLPVNPRHCACHHAKVPNRRRSPQSAAGTLKTPHPRCESSACHCFYAGVKALIQRMGKARTGSAMGDYSWVTSSCLDRIHLRHDHKVSPEFGRDERFMYQIVCDAIC